MTEQPQWDSALDTIRYWDDGTPVAWVLGGADGHTPVAGTMREAGALLHDIARRRVAYTAFPEREAVVSTVFLTVPVPDDNSGILAFESLVSGGPLDNTRGHYATWDDAVQGHEHLCRLIAALLERSTTRPTAPPATARTRRAPTRAARARPRRRP